MVATLTFRWCSTRFEASTRVGDVSLAASPGAEVVVAEAEEQGARSYSLRAPCFHAEPVSRGPLAALPLWEERVAS